MMIFLFFCIKNWFTYTIYNTFSEISNFCIYEIIYILKSIMHGILYYSTISGNTALVAEAIQEFMAKAGITLTLQDLAEDTTWQEGDFVILACGTY